MSISQDLIELQDLAQEFVQEIQLEERKYQRDKSGKFSTGAGEYGGSAHRQDAQAIRKEVFDIIERAASSRDEQTGGRI